MGTLKPNADEILARIKKREEKKNRGRLKIFFGMCAGAGKTYSMLQETQSELNNGTDAVIGYVETHGREETEALTKNIPFIPRKKLLYNNIELEEMDIDAILLRKPALVLVDELAHTNAPGSRHNKRYLDVLEILDKGIDVFTTLNVQHLESKAGTVAQISGIIVRETVPDSILDNADEIALIDISPEELLERLEEGKVYKGEQSARAIENFFKVGNLTALREMSLRLTADRVDKQLRDYMHDKRIPGPWKSGQRILVAVSASPSSEYLIRWARSVSYSMHASWIALYVETSKPAAEADIPGLKKNLDLARELGAEIMTTSDENIVQAIIRTAKEENVSLILAGKPEKRKFPYILSGRRIADRLIEESGSIDVYVVGTETGKKERFSLRRVLRSQSGFVKYFTTFLIITSIAVILYPLSPFLGYQTVAMILLLAVALLPLIFGPGPVLLAAGLSALIWNFFFIPPRFTFNIGKSEDVLMFAMYFIIATVTSILTTKIRAREYAVRQREKRALALYNLANELSGSRSVEDVLYTVVSNIKQVFNAECVILLSDSKGVLFNTFANENLLTLSQKELSVAAWSFANGKKAGRFTNTLPSAEGQYYPLSSPRKIFGAAAIMFNNRDELKIDEETLLGSFISQAGVAIERELLNESSKRALLIEESEKLYKNLFNSISHELKTPLAAIMSISNYLKENSRGNPSDTNILMLNDISIASTRLNRLVENLLDMTRIESGSMELNLKWFDVHDLINSTLKNLNTELSGRKIKIEISPDIKPVKIDFVLMEQVLKNILINASVYTPAGTEILIRASTGTDNLIISVSDCGQGVDEAQLEHIFDKFYRVSSGHSGGTGLGLSISKGFVEAHGGTITAKNIPGGGLEFDIEIPQNFEEYLIHVNG